MRRGRQSAGSHASHQVDGGPYVDPGEVIDAAIAAIRGGRDWAVEDLVRRLQGAEWGERVRSELVTRLEKGLATLWERGWQPADVVRVARDVPLPPLAPALPTTPADPDRLLDLAERWNLAGPCRRLVDALREAA